MAGETRDPLACLELALALFAPVLEQFRTDPRPTWLANEEESAKIYEAEVLLTEAVETLRRHDNPTMLHTALVNRAAIRSVIGRSEDAVKDCDRVLLDDPKIDWAWQNKANALLQLERYEDAIVCYEQIADSAQRNATCLPLAYAYSMMTRWDKVIQALEPMWPVAKDFPTRAGKFRLADLLVTAYHQTQRSECAATIIQELLTNFPDDPDALWAVARQRRREDNVEGAAVLFQRAMDNSDGKQRLSIQLDYALLYFYGGDFAEAAELFRPYMDQTQDALVFPLFTTSLVNAGMLKEALERAQEKRGNGTAIPVVSEAEAFVLEFVGDLAKAKELDLQLAEAEPDNSMHVI